MAGSSIAQVNSGHDGNHPATIKVEINNPNRASGCNFLSSWTPSLGSSAIQDILTANGETFTVLNSSMMSTTDFELYDVIIMLQTRSGILY